MASHPSPLAFTSAELQVLLPMLRSAPFSKMTAWLVPAETVDWLVAHDGAGLSTEERHNLVMRLRTLDNATMMLVVEAVRAYWTVPEPDRSDAALRELGLLG